jgi:hypothetical protein
MHWSIFDPRKRRIIFPLPGPDDGASPQDVCSFLERLHESVNETLDVTVHEDNIELRLEHAPTVWHLLDGIRTGQVEGSVAQDTDGKNYIRLGKPGPADQETAERAKS